MLRIVGFALFFIIFLSLLGLLNYAVLARFASLFGLARGARLIALAAVLSVSFLAANLLASRVPGGDYLYIAAAAWIGIVFILGFVLLMTGLANLIMPLPPKTLGIISLSIGLGLIGFAIVAGNILTTKQITIESPKISEPMRIVHLTDLHLGHVRSHGHVARVVERTAALKPDVVVITGDVFDGPGAYDPQLLKPFDTIDAPVLFVYGNHERYTGQATVDAVVGNTRIRTLRGDSATVRGVTFLGIDDVDDPDRVQPEREKLPVTQNYTVLLYHRPTPWRTIRDIDLQLSGHTHAGQVFPFTLLIPLKERPIAGLHKDGEKTLYVAPGTGTWGPPMRLGSTNQITLITLAPAS